MIRLFFLTATLSVLPACSDQSLKTINSIPVATITSHDAGDEFMEGDQVTFRGSVTDTDQASNQLRATWYVGSREACATTGPSSEGETECAIVLEVDSTEVRLEAQDPQDAAGSDSITIAIVPTDAPWVNILQPVVGGIYYSDQLITFEGTVTDGEDDPSDLIVTWESSIDAALDVGNEPDSSGSVTGHGYLSEGDHAIELHAEDSTGKTGSDDVVIRVGPPNSTPLCEIRAPDNGDAIEEGSLVIFNATVSDADVPADWLSVTWESDKDDALGESTPYSSGEVQFTWSDLSVGTHTITMTVTDEVGATCTDGILFTVSTAPVVALLAPEDGDVYSEGDSIAFAAQVSDNEDSETDLTLSWDSDIDGTVSTQGADSSGRSAFTLTSLSAAEHTLTLTVTDPDGLYSTALAYFTVNAVPTRPDVIINPDPAQSDDDLVATASGSIDPDGSGIVTYAYAWYESGMLSSASTSATFPASATSKDLIYKVVVTPNDGESDGVAGEAEITIGNSPPEVSVPTISPSTGLTSTGTATCSATATDIDGDTPSLDYTWTNDTEGTTLASEYSVTLSPSAVTLGDVLSCQATATDDEGATDSASTSVTVGNSAPSISSVSVAPNPARATDTLSCTYSGYSDLDEHADVSTLAWTINGAPAGSGSTLSGSLSSGDTVVCTVTPNDGTDTGTPVSDSVIVVNTPPVLTDVTLTPNPAYADDTLTCTPGVASDDDGDAVSYSYAWTVDGLAPGVTTATLSSIWFDRGDSVNCTVTPTDGTDDGVAVTSEGISISNTPPAIGSVSVTPVSPLTTDTVTCSYSGYSDLDEDADVSTLAWTINGAPAGSGSTLSGSLSSGDTVVCTVTPNDGTDTGTPVSDSVIVVNTPPEIISITLAPSTIYTNDVLAASVITSDAEGDTVGLSYAWYVDDSPVSATGSSLDGATYFDRGQTVHVVVTPNDGTSDGAAGISSDIIVRNTAPTAPVVSIDPTDPYAGTDDLVCLIDTLSTDDDGDTISYAITWEVDGDTLSEGTSTTHETDDTIDGADTFADEGWVCTVTPNDGSIDGPSDSASVTVISGDSDGDGVPDFDDLCPGDDDSIDANGNGIPDACEVNEVFSYTGSAQTFVLPADVSRVFIEADGAKGWTAGYPGGEGGFASGTLVVSPGDALYVYVGGQGEMSTPAYSPSGAGWNGGGDGQNNGSGGAVGGGGGASDVRLVYASDPLDATSLDSRVLVAAGGGGATSNTNAYGGDGGGLTGEDGGQHSSYHYGRGGTQSGGGDSSGGFGYGGNADGSMTPWNGGGGGGWYGGGVSTAHSGGGGGSSYTGGVTDGTVERGGNNGNGKVTIYWAERP